jgi:valyl-tRNA synthetase
MNEQTNTTAGELATKYTPGEVETGILRAWNEAKAFSADPAKPGLPYAIVIPPPNVTAALHMGHALNNTLQDILIRRKRMQGFNTLWMPGTDHAGIATQTVVEKRVLAEEGKRRTDFKREEFVAKIQKWKDEYEGRITDQLKLMGCSCDWDRQRFTMDPVCAAAVREAFFRLFRDGLIYRGKRLVNWDPATQTALADDEVDMKEVDGNFYYLRYPLVGPALANGQNYITVATTRPETMLGDTAVAINPKDPRAAELKGRMVILPIVNRIIPIIEDDYVVLPVEFGGSPTDSKAQLATGFLKVTPAHDPNDYEIGRRHNLAVINVFGPDGAISKEHGWPAGEWDQTWLDNPMAAGLNDAGFLVGLDRFEARKAIVRFFKEREMSEAIKPYRHSVGHSYRSHVPIEPYLSDQWYVKVTDARLAQAANKALVKEQRSIVEEGGTGKEWEGKLKFHPERYAKTYESWHENIRDWCISRQLWWGHRIPVWSSRDGVTNVVGLFDALKKLKEMGHGHRFAFTHTETGPIKEESDGKKLVPIEVFVCLAPNTDDIQEVIESFGLVQDPDVLDTWFSSALWPFSTLGWPNPEAFAKETGGPAALDKWNPGSVLCTAREIITLWVSRMVMTNLYFLDRLPFTDVFVHAMIQDGHGQKMSKSLGNGVDPLDIIQSHGADAMRFTLTLMTTQTQDVRLPVNIVCPFTAQAFQPKYIVTGAGHTVAAPVQECPTDKSKKFASSYGAAAGVPEAAGLPVARNTSEKFDIGRNFANKLWNATRFSLGNLEAPLEPSKTGASDELSIADRWILSRLARTLQKVNAQLDNYQFADYGQELYDFVWRDLCDWYIEAVKPTIKSSPLQRRVLATCLDAALRIMHPAMPFVTEKLWERLNAVVPVRGVDGLELPGSVYLINAQWPGSGDSLIDAEAEVRFGNIQAIVSALREARTTYKVPPRQKVTVSAKTPAELAQKALESHVYLETLANVTVAEFGPNVARPADAALAIVGPREFYLHGLVDADQEKGRLGKRAEELKKQIQALEGRLGNRAYTDKAPANLVAQTRDQLTKAQAELAAIEGR